MHQSMLAYEAPLVCALTSFAAALLFAYSWAIRARPPYVLVGAAGWLSWTIYFSLLAISAGPAPMLARGDMVAMVRASEMLGGLLLAVWLVCWVRFGIRLNAPNRPGDNDNYPREAGNANGG